MRSTATLAVSSIFATAVLAGCGEGEDARSRRAGQAAGGSGTKAPRVDMRNIRFEPADVVVRRGGTITWINRDALAHTVTKTSGPGTRFDSGTVPGGGTYRRTFTTPGVIRYVCTIHPNQTGTITVK